MCQTICHNHCASTRTDFEFDSSLYFQVNSLDSSFQLKENQVETLLALHSVQDVMAVLPTWIREESNLSAPPLDQKIESHDQEKLPKMAYNLSEFISACMGE